MKKQLFAIAAIFAACVASAAPFSVADKMKLHPENCPGIKAVVADEVIKSESPVASRAGDAADEVYYSLAGEPYQAMTSDNAAAGMTMGMAFQIEPSFLSGLTDHGKITKISYFTGTYATERVNKITKATVFIAKALDGNYLYTQETTAPETAFTQVDVTLDTPFEIPANTKIYVGVYFTLPDADCLPVVVDFLNHTNSRGGWVGTRPNAVMTKWTWDNVSDYYGFVTLGATIESNSLPQNAVTLVDIDGQPAQYEGTPFPFDFLLRNDCATEIKNITFEYGIDGEEPLSETIPVNEGWGINQSMVLSIYDFVAAKPTKGADVTVKVTKINGVDNTASKNSGSYPVVIVPEGKGFPKNAVIEEFTSTSCSACPIGVTSMEKIHDGKFNGRIIPVSVHVNNPGTDKMTAISFNSLWTAFSSNGTPASAVNRKYTVYPYYEDLLELSQSINTLPAIAQVKASATLDKATRKLTVDTESSFAFDYTDGNKSLRLAFAITENEVGPYEQTNGYAGASYDVPGGWNALGTKVEMMYNDVARQLDSYVGVAGSIPTEITAGETYKYTHEMTVNSSVTNLDNINVIVYVINLKTKEVENSNQLVMVDGELTGINDAVCGVDSSDAPVEYYNLQGVRVANPSAGLYIRRQGNNASKVYIK